MSLPTNISLIGTTTELSASAPATSVGAWPTSPLSGSWGTSLYEVDFFPDYDYFSVDSYADLTITNDQTNNRVTITGSTGTTARALNDPPGDAESVTTNTDYITYTGYTNPTIEYRYVQVNRQVDSVSYFDSTAPSDANSGTWFTIASGDSVLLSWRALESPANPFGPNTMSTRGATVAYVSNDSVYFEVRISQPGLPTVTRTSSTEAVNLSCDLYDSSL